MSTPQAINPQTLEGTQLLDNDGDKVGKITTVFLDTQSNQPEWVSVKTGFFGGNETLVPLATASLEGDELRVPFPKSQIKDAPHHDPEADLSAEDEAELYRYYGLSYGGGASDGSARDTELDTASTVGSTGSEVRSSTGTTTGTTETSGTSTTGTGTSGTTGYDTSGPTTDDAMTRSEERLHVGTEQVETGRARLRKYIVSEQVTQTVPVSHEEVRVEREPITDANVGAALDGPELSEEEHEVVLHAERPVVAKETVPVERVRLETDTVTTNETVDETVRKEQIDTTSGDAVDRDVR